MDETKLRDAYELIRKIYQPILGIQLDLHRLANLIRSEMVACHHKDLALDTERGGTCEPEVTKLRREAKEVQGVAEEKIASLIKTQDELRSRLQQKTEEIIRLRLDLRAKNIVINNASVYVDRIRRASEFLGSEMTKGQREEKDGTE